MARAFAPHSATTQFYVVDADAHFLDGHYAVFGRLLEGEATLDAIATTETDDDDVPNEDVIIHAVTRLP